MTENTTNIDNLPPSPWAVALDVWADFTRRHRELGYRPGKTSFHNFLRWNRPLLLEAGVLRLAKSRHWIAHRNDFHAVAFDCATGQAVDRYVPLRRVVEQLPARSTSLEA